MTSHCPSTARSRKCQMKFVRAKLKQKEITFSEEGSVPLSISCSISKKFVLQSKDFILFCIYLFRSRVLELDFLGLLVQIINHIHSAYLMTGLTTLLGVSLSQGNSLELSTRPVIASCSLFAQIQSHLNISVSVQSRNGKGRNK